MHESHDGLITQPFLTRTKRAPPMRTEATTRHRGRGMHGVRDLFWFGFLGESGWFWSMWLHPLLASPIKGEVPAGDCGGIEQKEWSGTSPLMGEVGRGCLASAEYPSVPARQRQITRGQLARRQRWIGVFPRRFQARPDELLG